MAKVKKMAFGGMSAKAADAALKAAQRDMDARKNAAAQQRNEEIARTTGYIGVKPPPQIAAIQNRMKDEAAKNAKLTGPVQVAKPIPLPKTISGDAARKPGLGAPTATPAKPMFGFSGLGAKIDAAKARAEVGTPSKSMVSAAPQKPMVSAAPKPMGGGAGFGNPAAPAKFAAVKSAMTGKPSPAKPAGLGARMKSGGSVSSASKRADGIATKGKTKGRMC